jgi:hypothetical protein
LGFLHANTLGNTALYVGFITETSNYQNSLCQSQPNQHAALDLQTAANFHGKENIFKTNCSAHSQTAKLKFKYNTVMPL